MRRLEDHLRGNAHSKLLFTGVCVNLMTLQPEICLTLYIDDPSWLEREMTADVQPLRFGWEIARPGQGQMNWGLELDDEFRPTSAPFLRPSNLVPQAAGAIYLASRALGPTLDRP